MKKNRFLNFLSKRKRIFNIGFYLFFLTGVTVVLLFFLEFFFKHTTSYVFKVEGWGYSYNPFLGYTYPTSKSINYCEEDDSIVIYFYGGSTMVGLSGTTEEDKKGHEDKIPSLVSEKLCEKGYSVKVKNRAVVSYINSQSMIRMILDVKDEDGPDIVVFYDGMNEFGSTYPGYPNTNISEEVFNFYTRKAGNPLFYTSNYIKSLFTERPDEVHSEIKMTDFFDYMPVDREKVNCDVSIAEAYLENVELISNLEDGYRFRSLFYWQPFLGTKEVLSEKEKDILEQHKNEIRERGEFYDVVLPIIRENDKVKNITDIFNSYEDTIYRAKMYVNREGNRIIAERMVNDIENIINYSLN